ncbi:hypothetical protein PR048_030187 [Dryococelus australis]|uniref:Uncharacterized protein n=1 Tax=Dryococelus australis TaxID=614101 RepID=A0ABQ9GB42_9NEOP|nr:hypothetical protein PR048_030187 [Dryococelus australis]
MSDTTLCLPATISFLGSQQQAQDIILKDSTQVISCVAYLKQNPRVKVKKRCNHQNFGRFHYWVGIEDIDNTSNQGTMIANALVQQFISFETILVGMVSLLIFKITTPLLDYIQTKKLDYEQAWRIVSSAQNELEEARSQYNQVFREAKMFAFGMSRLLDEKIEVSPPLDAENLYLELELPCKRSRKIEKMPDYEETARFPKLMKCLPSNAFDKICDLVPNIDKGKLIEELKSFVQDWPQISSSLMEEYTRNADGI